MKIVMPGVKYEIIAEAMPDGDWSLHYAEYHTEEDWDKAIEGSKKLFGMMGGFANVELDESQRKAYFTLQGSKEMILNVLATEFLGASQFGHMSLKDIFGTMAAIMAKRGVFETNDEVS